ncbi:MAG: tetratricopeptide repeat protein [Pseudomonadota bacterium]|jgi:TolA-binding protein|nr:tetratricopeptide repeat protein [Alphaproteobacteria bacterium]
MNILKALIILTGISFSAFCANVEEAIRQNEVVIDALQKQLDAMQASGEKKEAIEALQAHVDSIIEKQNKLLAQKLSPNAAENPSTIAPTVATDDLEGKIRRVVQEELAKNGIKSSNPYDTQHKPTAAELDATKLAEANAPTLPEQKSEAVAQYEVALKLYEQGSYKEAAAGFGRIIKTYPNDPMVGKVLVHLAYCLEKQGDIENASVVCDAALKKKLDDVHQVDCQIIQMRLAKTKNNTEAANQIMKNLQGIPLTPEQQKAIAVAKQQPAAATAAKPALPTKEARVG